MIITKIILGLFALIGICLAIRFSGRSITKQIQSGMFAGFGLGCVLIILFGF